MTQAVQLRKGTTSEHASFTGLQAEATVDTTKKTIVIHDGSTAGGVPLSREDLSNSNPTNLSAINGADTASSDLFVVYDVSASALKKITRAELNNAIEQDALASVAITGGTINNTAIGGSTAAAGSFTTLTTSSTVTLNGGTANGVLYLNGSKVATSGSALTFDGNYLSAKGVATSGTATTAALFTGGVTSTTGSGAVVYLSDGGTARSTYISGFSLDGTTNAHALSFGVSAAYAAPSEGMRLTSTGLGIGTSSPSTRLHVVNNSANVLGLFSSSYAYGTAVKLSNSSTGGTDWTLYSFGQSNAEGAGNFGIANTAGNKFTLDSSGNLGLGVTPSAWGSSWRAFEMNGFGLMSNASNPGMYLMGNAYYNGTNYIYKATAAASNYTQTAGEHKWFNAPSGTAGNAITFTQAMTLDASGNLGVGTTSPAARINAEGAGPVQTILRTTGASSYTSFRLYNDQNSSNRALEIDYYGSTASGGERAEIFVTGAYFLAFGTNNTERARVTSGGYFKASNSGTYAGSTASYHELYSNASGDWIGYFTQATASSPNGVVIQYTAAAPNGTGNTFLYCQDNAAVRATIRSNGGLANYSANDVNLSDRREKTNFAPAKSYLDTICSIPVQTFNYIDQSEDDPGLTLGVVAQDVQAVAPELVMESNWGTKEEPKMRLSIYQTDLQYALMKCIQEQQALITSLTARVALLEGN